MTSTDQHCLTPLSRLGRLLDEAVDIADRHGETLLAAQIAQALHTLDARIATLRDAPLAGERRAITRGGGGIAS